MDDNLDSEPPRKKFKREQVQSTCLIKDIPLDILREIFDCYLDTKTIYNVSITCHYFYQRNLVWPSITKLNSSIVYIPCAIRSVEAHKITKLSFSVDEAHRLKVLSHLLQFTNVRRLSIKEIPYYDKISVYKNVLLNFPLLRELKTPAYPELHVNHPGSYLTKLDAGNDSEFDVKCIAHFHKLEVLTLTRLEKLIGAKSITNLKSLTAITLRTTNISDADFEALCKHTQLRYLNIEEFGHEAQHAHLTNLRNLTTLKCSQYKKNTNYWPEILAPLTALQHISIPHLKVTNFSPQLGSSLTHLYSIRSSHLSHVLQLSSLQCLYVMVSEYNDVTADGGRRLSELQQLTKLCLWFIPKKGVQVQVENPFWTALTHLSCLRLGHNFSEELVNRTKKLLPAVQVETS